MKCIKKWIRLQATLLKQGWSASASRHAFPAMTAKETHRLAPESSYFLK